MTAFGGKKTSWFYYYLYRVHSDHKSDIWEDWNFKKQQKIGILVFFWAHEKFLVL